MVQTNKEKIIEKIILKSNGELDCNNIIEINDFLNDLYKKSNLFVFPLTSIETNIYRKLNGIGLNSDSWTESRIISYYKISEEELNIKLNKINTKIIRGIKIKKYLNQINLIDDNLNKPLHILNLPEEINKLLISNNIIEISQICDLTLIELSKLNGMNLDKCEIVQKHLYLLNLELKREKIDELKCFRI